MTKKVDQEQLARIARFDKAVQEFDWQTVVDTLAEIGGWGYSEWKPTVQELKDKAGYLFYCGWGGGATKGWEEDSGLKVHRQTGEIQFDYEYSKEYHAKKS